MRRAVARGSALDDVGYENIFAVDVGPSQNQVQKTAGRTDKRVAAEVFIFAWPFANNHELRGLLAITRNGKRARVMQRTFGADANLRGQIFQRYNIECLNHRSVP